MEQISEQVDTSGEPRRRNAVDVVPLDAQSLFLLMTRLALSNARRNKLPDMAPVGEGRFLGTSDAVLPRRD